MEWAVGILALLVALAFCACALSLRTAGQLRARLLRRDRTLASSIALVDMAEQLADLGRWRADPHGGQEWSKGLCRITGFPPGMAPDYETQRELMVDGGAAFYGALERHKRDIAPFAFELAIDRVDGERRLLEVVARNEFDTSGKLVQRHGIALDVTERRRQLHALAREKREAVAAAEDARKLAETDPLTGLANRRRAMAEADTAALAASREGVPLALVMFDIDHFKAVNDRHGHLAGDEVLKLVAEISRLTVRAGDTVGRIGGEEFLCVLPGADLAVARQCAERLRKAVANGSGVGGVPPVTISAGFAGWRKGDSALALFARADAALYDAKRSGRDCVRRAA